jgi:hypothetical protein
MEISDADERHHRPPPGWKLERVDYNVFNSSQIFRYVPVKVATSVVLTKTPGILAMVGACGTAILGLPLVHAILENFQLMGPMA